MAITAPLIRINYRYTYLGQKCQNIQYFEPDGTTLALASMAQVLEAEWNHIKAQFRVMFTDFGLDFQFDSLLGAEIGGGLSYAEYAIPAGERTGTRGTSGVGDPLASFVSSGFRQTVATRVTRPGQKRLPGLFEVDVSRQVITGAYVTNLIAFAGRMSLPHTLGVPVAAGVLHPAVVSFDRLTGAVLAQQRVTGFVINANVTTQNSRKQGRGE